MRRLATILSVAIVACGSQLDSLPPAPTPASFEGGPWAIEFRLDLAPGFWEVGRHRYQLWLECEEIGPRQWSQHNFEANTETALIADQVYLRFSGLSLHKSGPTGIKEINTAQPTVALVTVINLDQEQAERAVENCVAELRLQDGSVHLLAPSDPFRV